MFSVEILNGFESKKLAVFLLTIITVFYPINYVTIMTIF